jgi:glycosyltransferase involved in cell wall biosynthesis
MKIACISASQVPSDTANSIQAMKVCQALAQLGHEIVLLVPGPQPSGGGTAQLLARYGLLTPFEIRWIAAKNRSSFPRIALRQARQLGASLIYCWPIPAAALALLGGLPTLLEMHDLPSGVFGPLWYALFLVIPGRKRVVVITQALQNRLIRRFRVTCQSVIAPNGVDLERYLDLPDPDTARRELALRASLTVACTGHLYAGRGVEVFLALAKGLPQVQFLWVGGRPDDVNYWKARSLESGLQNTTFTGQVPNRQLPLYQAAADVLLMPYGEEISISSGTGHSAEISSPMKMFEYMAAGRAILASDLPVLHEILSDQTAVFCPPGDVPAWKSSLDKLLSNLSWRQSLGLGARSQVAKYSWIERARRCLEGFDS